MSAGQHRTQAGARRGMTLGELYDLIIADTCGCKP